MPASMMMAVVGLMVKVRGRSKAMAVGAPIPGSTPTSWPKRTPKPPEDGKIRKVKPAYNWLRLLDEFLHPRPESIGLRPINYSWVYTSA